MPGPDPPSRRFSIATIVALEPFRAADWRRTPLDGLIGEIRRLQDLHGDSQWYVFVGAMNMTVRSKLLQRFSRRHAPEVAPADLTRGLVGLKSLEPNIELRRMAAGACRWMPRPEC